MSRKDEHPIGTIFTRKKGTKLYRVIEAQGCDTCHFLHKEKKWCDVMQCAAEDRTDGRPVVFRRIHPKNI